MIREMAQAYVAWNIGRLCGVLGSIYAVLMASGYFLDIALVKLGEISRMISGLIGSTFVALVVLTFSIPTAHAGMTVSDPTSYIYYMQQMMQQTESLTNQAKQLEQMERDYDQYVKMVESMAGVFEYAGNTLNELKKMKQEVESNPSVALEYLQALFKDRQEQEKYLDENGYVDTEKLLNESLGDINSASTDPFVEWAKRRKMQQAAIRSAIIDAERIVQKRDEEIINLQELVAQIKGDSPQQASQVLTNHFLAEILRCLQEFKALHARMVGMEGYFKYDGPSAPSSADGNSLEEGDVVKVDRSWENKVQRDLEELDTSLLFGS